MIIVESPSKAKTIAKYLGENYEVTASVGHVKDLPKNEMGVDLDNNFEPKYVTIRGKNAVLQKIKQASKKVDNVYLAPDPDREGEAIAWHIADEIRKYNPNCHRVLFNEITKSAVQAALQHPQALDQAKYESQQARRILDRLVGYQISPLLWEKVRRGLSAGRVQSVAVRLIVDREKEIQAFQPEEYWTLQALLDADAPPPLNAKLAKRKHKKFVPANKEEMDAVLEAIDGAAFSVSKIEKKRRKRRPLPPFITSKLQQDGSRRFGFTAKRTMMIAQRLYEGIDLGARGTVGLISYMRTDSTRLSNDSIAGCRAYVEKVFGADYLPKAPIHYKTKKSAQDAHEAIRPTDVNLTPSVVKPFLSPEQMKLYTLIWERFVACQMNPAEYDQTSVEITAADHQFTVSGSVQVFAGFTVIDQVADEAKDDEQVLPDLVQGQALALRKLLPEQKFTQPPPRFNEATLVKELEERGIGRPSTYASIISTILDKTYVERQKNRFFPTELGRVVTELLIENFPHILDAEFTARMEDNLDQIESGKANWLDVLREFYDDFKGALSTAKTEMRNVKRQELKTDLTCPKCNAGLVIKFGRNGSFLACSSYPECKYTSEFERDDNGALRIKEDEKSEQPCPKCSRPLVIKNGRFGRFLACSGYPECSHTEPLTLGMPCPVEGCTGRLMEKRTRRGKPFYACTTFPKCDFASWNRPLEGPCPTCKGSYLEEKKTKDGMVIACPNKECGWTRAA